MIGYHWRVEIPGRLAIGWCHEVPLRLMLVSRLSWVMAHDWVVPLVPLKFSVIILHKAKSQVLGLPQVVKIGTTHNWGSSLRAQLVTLLDQHLTRPWLADHVLGPW